MSEIKYLYGAAVQGIQNFIFQTNELKDIVGASELVEKICTEDFEPFRKNGKDILHAAGNIKYIFNKKNDCEKAVKEFPKIVLNKAPGIIISQAVVEIKAGETFGSVVDKLEDKLRSQRNKPNQSITLGYMGILRSRKTGLPAIEIDKKGDFLDLATYKKRSSSQSTPKLCKKLYDESSLNIKKIPFDIEDITQKNDWIAIIHADGNGLGQIVQKIGKDENQFADFSKKLDEATVTAAQTAFKNVCSTRGGGVIPIRPVVLGGDDLTVVCRGDLAIDFAESFLMEFEHQTQQKLGLYIKEAYKEVDKLTACAGIAYIKSSYPFYYGYELAEALCSEAKKDAKKKERIECNNGMPPSCLMFHKVQDSFVEDYSEIVKRELTPFDGYSFKFGPYYVYDDKLDDDKWTISELKSHTKDLDNKSKDDKEGNAIKSHLRQWLSSLHENNGSDKQLLERMISITPKNDLKRLIDKVTQFKDKTPVYDMLSYHSIYSQVTK